MTPEYNVTVSQCFVVVTKFVPGMYNETLFLTVTEFLPLFFINVFKMIILQTPSLHHYNPEDMTIPLASMLFESRHQ